jgi:hypothetical protein
VLAINFAPVPDKGTLAIELGVVALVALCFFYLPTRRTCRRARSDSARRSTRP